MITKVKAKQIFYTSDIGWQNKFYARKSKIRSLKLILQKKLKLLNDFKKYYSKVKYSN